jgi:hypothetical protein
MYNKASALFGAGAFCCFSIL